jgi:dienelactone hydrolase
MMCFRRGAAVFHNPRETTTVVTLSCSVSHSDRNTLTVRLLLSKGEGFYLSSNPIKWTPRSESVHIENTTFTMMNDHCRPSLSLGGRSTGSIFFFLFAVSHIGCVRSFVKQHQPGPGFFVQSTNHHRRQRQQEQRRQQPITAVLAKHQPHQQQQQQRCRKQPQQPLVPSRMLQHVLLQGQTDDYYDYEVDYDIADDLVPSTITNSIDDLRLTRDDLEALTVPQLKQQLRLRGLKVTGKKQELIERFLAVSYSSSSPSSFSMWESEKNDLARGGTRNGAAGATATSGLNEDNNDDDKAVLLSKDESKEAYSKAMEFAKANGKELIDVTAYLDEDDQGKKVKSFGKTEDPDKDESEDATAETADSTSSSSPEVWGSEAKIVEDFEGRNPVVDALSRTVVEFLGSNRTMAQAYVVASRDALKPFLRGGANKTNDPNQQLREIQLQREKAVKRPIKFDEVEGLDEGDEANNYKDVLHRDFSDWGEFTLTGAQLSAQEVQGVLLLSDVNGAFSEDTKALAEKIAFECQPVVVMVPDLFRGKPWNEDPNRPGFTEKGLKYETWLAKHHPDLPISVDIRAAAACLRDRYGVSSVTLWGMGYGGGRALEAATGYLPGGSIFDIDGSVGPPPVDPVVAVAWYPTRYNVVELFGPDRTTSYGGELRRKDMAVMAVFAGNDVHPGATPQDAAALKALLEVDDRVKDHMIKVFPDQEHGFAHIGLGGMQQDDDYDEMERFADEEFGGAGRMSIGDGDEEVACLLSTAFMETYSRVFLPTTGPAISQDEDDEVGRWKGLEMQPGKRRDIRKEIEEGLAMYKDEPLGGSLVDRTNEDDDKLKESLRSMQPKDVEELYKIKDDDTVETMYAKLKAGDDNFQLF